VFNLKGVAKRAAFVLNEDHQVVYSQVLESAGDLPDFDAIRESLK
jgi:peroxiredoxin